MRWTMLVWSCGFVGMAAAPGCLLLTPGADGESCIESRDCDSGNCNQGFCGGSDCSEDEGICRDGWICTHHDADPISGFFGADGSDRCSATCGHCVGNTHCAEGGIRDETLCTFGKAPLVLQLSDSTAVVGQSTKLIVMAKDGSLLSECTWNLGETAPVVTAGGVVEHVFRNGQTIRVGVSCTDLDERTGQIDALVVVSCQAVGSACDPTLCCEGTVRNGCLGGDAPGTFVCREPRAPTVTVHGPTEVPVDTSVQFSVSIVGDGEIDEVEWTFSDSGFNDRGLTTEHDFDEPGSYTVSASVRDSFGSRGQGGLVVTAR